MFRIICLYCYSLLGLSSFKIFLFNLTKCTPRSIYFQPNLHLISQNNNYSKIEQKDFINGFICSNCTRENFIEYHLNISDQCSKQITKIKLKNDCQFKYKQKKNVCQCFPSDYPIQPMTDWMKALVKPGKSDRNTNRVININKSASSFVYILVGFILLFGIFGGIIGMIFYWIKLKSSERRTLK